jgi:hypothetical protein
VGYENVVPDFWGATIHACLMEGVEVVELDLVGLTLGEQLAIAGLVITVVGIIASTAWWCSALYSRVNDISEKIDEIADNNREAYIYLRDKAEQMDEQIKENHDEIVHIKAHLWPDSP